MLFSIDVKDLRLYQQIVIYVIPLITNMAFINIVVVVVRLYWFEKHFKRRRWYHLPETTHLTDSMIAKLIASKTFSVYMIAAQGDVEAHATETHPKIGDNEDAPIQSLQRMTTIRFEEDSSKPTAEKMLYVPPPHLRDRGHPLVEIIRDSADTVTKKDGGTGTSLSPERRGGRSLERVASAAFSIGPKTRVRSRTSTSRERPMPSGLPKLSTQATIGRNSHFHNLSAEDREILGGVEYVALKLLLKVIVGSSTSALALISC